MDTYNLEKYRSEFRRDTGVEIERQSFERAFEDAIDTRKQLAGRHGSKRVKDLELEAFYLLKAWYWEGEIPQGKPLYMAVGNYSIGYVIMTLLKTGDRKQ